MRRVLRPGGELAVREGAGAAKTELDVALGVELCGSIEVLDRLLPAARVVAAFEQKRLCARLGKGERGEEAGATSPHDHRPRCGWRCQMGDGQRVFFLHDAYPSLVPLGDASQELVFMDIGAEKDADDEDEVDVVFSTSVN